MVKQSRSVRIYIEGGAPGQQRDSLFREGWRKFLTELDSVARKNGYAALHPVRGGSRDATFKSFKLHPSLHPADLGILLVDAEGPIPEGESPWDTARRTPGGASWSRPSWANAQHLYFMVQATEAWLLTDHDALRAYFGPELRIKHLPSTNLEQRGKAELDEALRRASVGAAKGAYKHGQAHEVLQHVRPERVKTLHHGARFFTGVARLIAESTGRSSAA